MENKKLIDSSNDWLGGLNEAKSMKIGFKDVSEFKKAAKKLTTDKKFEKHIIDMSLDIPTLSIELFDKKTFELAKKILGKK